VKIFRVEQTSIKYVHVLAEDEKAAELQVQERGLMTDTDVVEQTFDAFEDNDLGHYDYAWDETQGTWLDRDEAKEAVA
jgi:hypothetical protein